MSYELLALAVVAMYYSLFHLLSSSDIPKFKGLPEVPSVPIFGNVLQLGDQHAKIAGSWVENFGRVFQVRLGNQRKISWKAFTSLISLGTC